MGRLGRPRPTLYAARVFWRPNLGGGGRRRLGRRLLGRAGTRRAAKVPAVSAAVPAGVPLSFEAGGLVVEARPSEVAPDQLAALRRHKAALLPILAAFGAAE